MQSGFLDSITQWTAEDDRLMQFVEKEDLVKVRHMLKKKACPTKLHPVTGKTCLHYSVERGNLNLTKILAKNPNTDINCKDFSGKNPLYHAIEQGHFGIAEFLLERGATFKNQDEDGRVLLEKAVTLGDLDRVTLLLYGDCPTNCADEFGYTPLHIVAMKGQASISKVLVDKGVNINERTPTGLTPLMIASKAGHAHLCSFLLNNGVERSAVDNEGHDAMWHAMTNEKYEAFRAIENFELETNQFENERKYKGMKVKQKLSQLENVVSQETGLHELCGPCEVNDRKEVDDSRLLESENYKILKNMIEFDDAKDLVTKIEQTLETVRSLDDERNLLEEKLKTLSCEFCECQENLKQTRDKLVKVDKELHGQKFLEEENIYLKDLLTNSGLPTNDISVQTSNYDDNDGTEFLSQIGNLEKECKRMQHENDKLKFQICQFIDSRDECNGGWNDLEVHCYQTITSEGSMDELKNIINNLCYLIQYQNKDLTVEDRELEHLIGLCNEFKVLHCKYEKNKNNHGYDHDVDSNIPSNGNQNMSSVMNRDMEYVKEDTKMKENTIEEVPPVVLFPQQNLDNDKKKVKLGRNIRSLKEELFSEVTMRDVHLDNRSNSETDTKRSYRYIKFNDPDEKIKKCVVYLNNAKDLKKDVSLQCSIFPLDLLEHDPPNLEHAGSNEVDFLKEANRSLSLEVADLQYKFYERSQLILRGISVEATDYRDILHEKMKKHSDVVASYKDQIDRLTEEIRRLKEERSTLQRMNNSFEMDLQDLKEIVRIRNFPSSDGELVKKLRLENKKFQSLLEILHTNLSKTNLKEMIDHKFDGSEADIMEKNVDLKDKSLKYDIHSECYEEISRLNEILNKTEIANKETVSRLREYLLLSIQGNLDQEVKEALINILRLQNS